jgi:hypothetical protein
MNDLTLLRTLFGVNRCRGRRIARLPEVSYHESAVGTIKPVPRPSIRPKYRSVGLPVTVLIVEGFGF